MRRDCFVAWQSYLAVTVLVAEASAVVVVLMKRAFVIHLA
jgi:hypothetical protein